MWASACPAACQNCEQGVLGKGASEPLSFHTLTGNAAIQAVKAHMWLLQAGLGLM